MNGRITEDQKLQNLLNDLIQKSREILADGLTGIYLHGSLAMGCYNPKKSDVDLLMVVEYALTEEQKLSLMEEIVRLNAQAPPKGLEISVLKRIHCDPFIYPTPFELHFSPMHLQWFQNDPVDYIERMNGTDQDLAAHITVVRKCGIVLWGEPVEAVFGEVPWKDYLDSIYADVEHADKEILENPVYVILNLCRVLAAVRENLCLSKQEGGSWGLKHLPTEYQDLITTALECYRSGRKLTCGNAGDAEQNEAENRGDALTGDLRIQLEYAAEYARTMLRMIRDADAGWCG